MENSIHRYLDAKSKREDSCFFRILIISNTRNIFFTRIKHKTILNRKSCIEKLIPQIIFIELNIEILNLKLISEMILFLKSKYLKTWQGNYI